MGKVKGKIDFTKKSSPSSSLSYGICYWKKREKKEKKERKAKLNTRVLERKYEIDMENEGIMD